MVLSTAGFLVQRAEFFQPPLVVSMDRKNKETDTFILQQSEDLGAEVTQAGPTVNTGPSGSKAAFLLAQELVS